MEKSEVDHAARQGDSIKGELLAVDVGPVPRLILGQRQFQYHSIPTFALVPGAYTIGGQSLDGPLPSDALGVVAVPGFTWTQGGAFAIGAGLNNPNQGIFGAF